MQAYSHNNAVPLPSASTRQNFPDGLRLDINLGKSIAQYPVFLTHKPALLMAEYLKAIVGKPTADRPSLRLDTPPHVVVLCDENTAELFGLDIEAQFISAGWQVDALTIPAGEDSKSLNVAQQLCEALVNLGATRDTLLCSLGGGMVSDLAGFVAGIYKRGMHLAHVSTSLLGLVDASVGGKTAVNLPTGKNLVGLYKHPLAIASDPAFLQELPDAEYASGLAEAAKTALLSGESFTHWMEENTQKLISRDPDTLSELIARCISFKSSIVASDPTEDNTPSARLSLNYGHTLGHVIETLSAQSSSQADTDSDQLDLYTQAIPHGIAVAQGMRFEARMAMQLVDAPADFVLRQDALLDSLGLQSINPSILGEDLNVAIDIFYRDKKTQDNMLRFILLPAPGQPEIVTVPRDILLDHLKAWLVTAPSSALSTDNETGGQEIKEPKGETRSKKDAQTHDPADFSDFANYNPDTSPYGGDSGSNDSESLSIDTSSIDTSKPAEASSSEPLSKEG